MKKFICYTLICLFTLVLTQCKLTNRYKQDHYSKNKQSLRHSRQIKHYTNQIKSISGVYNVIPNYSTIPPTNSNHAELRLKDGFGLAIEIGKKGRRSSRELKKLNNKRVQIKGKIHKDCLLESKGYFSTFRSYCIINITAIHREK